MFLESVMLRRAQRYDIQALAGIYDQYSPKLYRYALRLLGDEDLAEECVAETFNRFLAALKNRKGPNKYLQAYLFRVAHNWVTDYYRSRPQAVSLTEENDMADSSSGLDVKFIEAHQSERVRKALTLLTPEQRQVVVLKYLEDWDNQQIAETVNKPVGAVKALQHRALNSLRRILSEETAI
jgi:RNA polymerase sigma-70 factor (ECF subfamily)